MSEFLRSTVRVVRVLRALAVVCLSVSAADLEELMVKPEQNVILKCPSKGHGVMDLLLWTRPDLRPELRPDLRPQQEDVYVFFYRNRRSNELYVDRQYRDRVHLDQDRVHLDQDRVHLDQDQDWVQTGSVSVRLDNVSAEDSGTYECQLKLTGRDAVETHRLKLTVTQPGAPGEVESGYSGHGDDSPANSRSPTTVLIAVVVVVVSVVFVISVAVGCIFLRFGSPNQEKKGKRIPQSVDACPLKSPELV